ncbi:MAG: acyl-CoA dehydrogenase family protein [Hyphomonadaceae bacterium]
MAWEFSTDPEFQAKLDWMAGFVRDDIEPLDLLWPHLHHTPPPAWLKAVIDPLKAQTKARGLWATHLEPALGGKGYGQVKLALMNEIVGRSPWAPTIFGIQGPDTGNAELLAHYGTPAQKERYLKPLLEGEMFSAFSMTEPQAGADPSYFTTRARKLASGEWEIEGEKFYTSNGPNASLLIVIAITDPDVPVHKGASMFLVPSDTPGIEWVRYTGFMGHTPDVARGEFAHPHVRYNRVRIPGDHLVGREGEGFKVAQTRLSGGRIHHAMRTVSICKWALDMMCERALSRHAFGGPVSEKQAVQQFIADSYAQIEMFRLFVLQTAWRIDNGHEGYTHMLRRDIALAKTWAYKLHRDVVERAIHVYGALGCSDETPLARLWMEAPSQGVMDGPYEAHQATAARQILKDYAPSVGVWPSEWLPAKREAARARYAGALAAQAANEEARD